MAHPCAGDLSSAVARKLGYVKYAEVSTIMRPLLEVKRLFHSVMSTDIMASFSGTQWLTVGPSIEHCLNNAENSRE